MALGLIAALGAVRRVLAIDPIAATQPGERTMRLALRELRRNPGRFVVATITISVIAILLMFLGALLDGLLQLSTGAYQAQRGQLIVLSADSKGVLGASQLSKDAYTTVTAATEDATGREVVDPSAGGTGPAIGGYGETTLGARLSGGDDRDLVSVRLRGYELAPAGLPATAPDAGKVWADPDLVGKFEVGDVLELGPARAEVEVIGFLDTADTPSLAGCRSRWIPGAPSPASARPDAGATTSSPRG